MGESAGAMAVGNIVNTMPDDPPFRAAIEMSGSSVVAPLDLGGNDADTTWPTLVELLNCTRASDAETLECMRATPAETIKNTLQQNSIVFSTQPANNITILDRPDLAWARGRVARVPLLIGSTADDGGYFVFEAAKSAMAANLSVSEALSALNLPSSIVDILGAMYTPGLPFAKNINNTQDAIFQLATDITFGCTSAFVANVTSSLLGVPVWKYVFDAVVPSNSWAEYPELGAWHASELGLVFGTYLTENATEVDAEVSKSIQAQFANFVKDPEKGPGWEQWPQVGILGVADGKPVTTTEDIRELYPICQEYNKLWLGTEVPALAEPLIQAAREGVAGEAGEAGDVSSEATSSISTVGISIMAAGFVFAAALS